MFHIAIAHSKACICCIMHCMIKQMMLSLDIPTCYSPSLVYCMHFRHCKTSQNRRHDQTINHFFLEGGGSQSTSYCSPLQNDNKTVNYSEYSGIHNLSSFNWLAQQSTTVLAGGLSSNGALITTSLDSMLFRCIKNCLCICIYYL